MNAKSTINDITDKFIYVSWGLLFFGILNMPLPILNASGIAVRINVAFAALVFFLKLTKQKISKLQLRLITSTYLLLTVQVIGLLGKSTPYSITSLLLILLVIMFIIYTVDVDYNSVNHKAFKFPYYLILFGSYADVFLNNGRLFDKYSIGDNTMGGMLVFLTIINIALSEYTVKHRKRKWLRIDFLALALLVPLLMFTRSRTSVATLVIILIIYFFFSKVSISRKKAHLLFWIFIIIVLCLSVVYAFITTFSFYQDWNLLSIQYFGKNIDSSRPMLWKASIEAIGGKWLFGLGTGTLPSDFMMFDASFHNQFLQIFMQNGVLGLSIFYYLLYTLWKPMAYYLRDPVIKVCAAAFFGIIIYNSFETTLLQNKMALGLIEWQLIALGVSRAKGIHDKELQRYSDTQKGG